MTAQLLHRVAHCLCCGETTAMIRAKLLAEGLTEEQAFFIFKAAQFYLARR